MNPIHEKTIILGVTGSIAGYKAAELTASLSHAGANVDVILTESAARFVSPLTFQSLTARKAYVDADLWNGEGLSAHLNLGQRANLMLIAPASANTIAKLAHGIGDNLLTATALTATCPLMIVPAMESSLSLIHI
jgi:phosphopantothenoylcysteine decarboxylase/phosphopantothenate--cysteine ligase